MYQKLVEQGETPEDAKGYVQELQIAKRNKKQHRYNAKENEKQFVQHNFSKIDKVYETKNKRSVVLLEQIKNKKLLNPK